MSAETEENIPDGFPVVPPNNMTANITIRYPDIITPDCLSSKSDMQSLCRICAAQTTKVIPLFKGLGVEYDLPAKMRKYISLRVLRSESLPQQICESCAGALLSWHELVRTARLTDYMLRSRFRAVSLSLPPSPPSETAGTEVIKNGVKYVDAGTDPPALPRARVCKICPLHVPAPRYNFHVGNQRANVVFRCEECHSYLDKDDLLFQMKGHTLDRVPDHVKIEFYRIERAALEQLAPTDEQARSDLDRLNEYFRKWQEELIKKRERATQEASEQAAIDRQSEGSDRGSEPPADEPQPPLRRSSKRTSDEGRRERDSDGESSPPKRGRIKPKRGSDAETSPAKRQNKRRAFIAKSGQRKELPDPDDDTPEASPNVGAVRVKKEASEKSPRASRTCPICGKQYRASSSYFYHMKYFHKRSREHECPVCNKKFGTKANLAQHASIHTGAYDLECKECGKRFKSKPSLYIHEQSHGGPKRWACSQCGRSFRWRTHLARHVTRHAAERAHVCGTCGRGFSVRCDLLRHARTHAAAEYHCATCGLKFAQKRYLQVHVVKKHREPPAPVVTRS